jgi:hypothetical protein
LFRRLTRSFDRRMLALLTGPAELRAGTPFAVHLHVASILSPEFLRFDAALPGGLRGCVTLYLEAADLLADTAAFTFARNYVRARGYRLLLRGASPALLALLDVTAAEIDYVQVGFDADLAADPDSLRLLVPRGTQVVVCDTPQGGAVAWAAAHGFALVRCHAHAG